MVNSASDSGDNEGDVAKQQHVVLCPFCKREFELFAAVWCEHFDTEPSKVCPHCARCACELPAYEEPNFWTEAPPAFRQHGFQLLFLYYL